MPLLSIKDHASEFNLGDYVLVAHRDNLGPGDLFAIGHLFNFGAYGYTISISSTLKKKFVEKSNDYWEYALKVPSELILKLQKQLKENT